MIYLLIGNMWIIASLFVPPIPPNGKKTSIWSQRQPIFLIVGFLYLLKYQGVV